MGKERWVGQIRRTLKPWGYEDLLAFVDGCYSGKLLFIKAGHGLSPRPHERAEKTLAVRGGHIVIEIGRSTRELERFHLFSGDTVRPRPGTVHQISAAVDSELIETPTGDVADVVPLADIDGRPLARRVGTAVAGADRRERSRTRVTHG